LQKTTKAPVRKLFFDVKKEWDFEGSKLKSTSSVMPDKRL